MHRPTKSSTLQTLQAQEILDNATVEANSVKASAIQYTDDILANLESIIGHGIDIATDHYGQLINDPNSCLNIVQSNRMELRPDEEDDTSSLPNLSAAGGWRRQQQSESGYSVITAIRVQAATKIIQPSGCVSSPGTQPCFIPE